MKNYYDSYNINKKQTNKQKRLLDSSIVNI